MKHSLFLFGAAAAALIAANPVLASDRYGERPPVVVSPDLSAPWVMQLKRSGNAPQQRQRVVTQDPLRSIFGGPTRMPSPKNYRERQPSQMQTAGIPAPARRETHPAINPMYLPQDVAYESGQKAGTIIIDTRENFLYLVQSGGKARRYGVGTGKPGFEWAGTHKITQKREWPDWRPPSEMIVRERAKGRVLPVHMEGGPANPLGARAMYLGSTLYRIHGTNQPWTIGGSVSSGCIRMRNEDVVDLYERVNVGTKVVVM